MSNQSNKGRRPSIKLIFQVEEIIHPELYEHLKTVQEHGHKGAAGQRMIYLASLGLKYENSSAVPLTQSISQVPVKQHESRVQVPQQEVAQDEPGSAGVDLSDILQSKGGPDFQSIVGKEETYVPVPQTEPPLENPALKLAQSLTRRGSGFGRTRP
jgi:hypothetical protein